jgi:hypothetical protein
MCLHKVPLISGLPASKHFHTLAFGILVALAIKADAQSVSPPNISQGRGLVDAIGIENIMTPPMHQQMLPFMRRLQEANKDRQQEIFDIFDTMVMPQAQLAYTSTPIKDEIAKFYAQNFSAAEMEELTAFFSTPLGKKYASKSSFLNDGLPRISVLIMGSTTVQGALRGGVAVIEKRGMVIPKPVSP